TMMCLSLILSALGAFIIGLSDSSLVITIFSFGLIGLGVGLYHPPGLSWVASAFKDEENGGYSSYINRILGVHGVGGTIGSAVGPISVFFLLNIMNWRQIYLLWSFPLFLLSLLFWVFVARFESPRERENNIHVKNKSTNFRIKLKSNISPTMLIIFVFMVLMSLTWGMVSFVLAPFLSEVKGFDISHAALFIGVSHLFGASGQLLGGVIADKYTEKVALLFASALQGVVILGIYILNPPAVLFALYMILFIVNAIFWPTTNSFLAKNTTQIGSAFGGFMLTVNVVRAAGPTIDGFLITLNPSNYLLIFVFAVIFSIAAFLTLTMVKGKSDFSSQDSGGQ
ncbi:MAG: MFS transporter, partial [Candidatus Heimdallarchaeota archaeon]|nr:MFS transporter [Candidatus Heimdallarchaeota archaeon]